MRLVISYKDIGIAQINVGEAIVYTNKFLTGQMYLLPPNCLGINF